MAAGDALMAASKAARRKKGSGNFIKGAIKHPGALHRALNVPVGQTIPASKLNAAASGEFGASVKRKADLAKTLSGLGKK
jgi:hypothetical protein